mgnify:CR=1 FL=1
MVSKLALLEKTLLEFLPVLRVSTPGGPFQAILHIFLTDSASYVTFFRYITALSWHLRPYTSSTLASLGGAQALP